MIRIIRTATLDAIRADRDKAAASATRAEAVAETQLGQIQQLNTDLFEARTRYQGLNEAVTRLTGERDAARTERDQVEAAARRELEEIRQDVDRLRAAAADPETGESMRHAIAYGVLRNLIEDARARGLELGRPFDLVAILLGFNDQESTRQTDAPGPVPTGLAEA